MVERSAFRLIHGRLQSPRSAMIDFDTSHAPLVIVRCQGHLRQDEVHRQLRAYECILDSGAGHAVLVLVRDVSVEGRLAALLDLVADWVVRRTEAWSRTCSACAMVLKDEALRHALGVVGGNVDFHGMAAESFRDGSDAVDWLEDHLDREIDRTRDATPILEPSDGNGRTLPTVRDIAASEYRDWSPYEAARPVPNGPIDARAIATGPEIDARSPVRERRGRAGCRRPGLAGEVRTPSRAGSPRTTTPCQTEKRSGARGPLVRPV